MRANIAPIASCPTAAGYGTFWYVASAAKQASTDGRSRDSMAAKHRSTTA
jgi:hypothetical protein